MERRTCVVSSPEQAHEVSTTQYYYDFMLYEVYGEVNNGLYTGKKIKTVYEARNALEYCNTYIFDGWKFNLLFDIWELGVTPNTSAFIDSPEERLERADELFKISQDLILKLLKGT